MRRRLARPVPINGHMVLCTSAAGNRWLQSLISRGSTGNFKLIGEMHHTYTAACNPSGQRENRVSWCLSRGGVCLSFWKERYAALARSVVRQLMLGYRHHVHLRTLCTDIFLDKSEESLHWMLDHRGSSRRAASNCGSLRQLLLSAGPDPLIQISLSNRAYNLQSTDVAVNCIRAQIAKTGASWLAARSKVANRDLMY